MGAYRIEQRLDLLSRGSRGFDFTAQDQADVVAFLRLLK
jgi:hypothetical protein